MPSVLNTIADANRNQSGGRNLPPSLKISKPPAEDTTIDAGSMAEQDEDQHAATTASSSHLRVRDNISSAVSSWGPSRRSHQGHFATVSSAASRLSFGTLSKTELVDLRAAQRTFDGAYARTALGQLSYAVVILKLFQPEFYYVGLSYTLLAIGLLLVAVYRYGLAIGNMQRWSELEDREAEIPEAGTHARPPSHDDGMNSALTGGDVASSSTAGLVRQGSSGKTASRPSDPPSDPPSRENAHAEGQHTPFMQTFRTAGSVVGAATAGVLVVEIALMLLVLKM